MFIPIKMGYATTSGMSFSARPQKNTLTQKNAIPRINKG